MQYLVILSETDPKRNRNKQIVKCISGGFLVKIIFGRRTNINVKICETHLNCQFTKYLPITVLPIPFSTCEDIIIVIEEQHKCDEVS